MNELPPIRPDWLRRIQARATPSPLIPRLPARSGTAVSVKRDSAIDATLALRADPYRYISRRCDRLGTDAFETRLMLRPAICLRGADAARLFHDPERILRAGTPDSDRQARLRAAMERAPIEGLTAAFVGEWEAAAPGWKAAGGIRFHSEMQAILTRAILGWAGVPLDPKYLPGRCRQLAAQFDHDAASGPPPWLNRKARPSAGHWLAGLVRRAHAGKRIFAPGSAAEQIAFARDARGTLLDPKLAGGDMFELLRPALAGSVYVTFIAHALALHPSARQCLASGGPGYRRAFLDEVRRLYPFLPPRIGQVRQDFDWRGAVFTRGRRVLLDAYGTNRHSDWWEQPEAFRPERFLGLAPNRWSFIPQGGGDPDPGERITVALMEAATDMLARRMLYSVPAQNLSVDFRKLSALPRGGMVLAIEGMN